MLGGWEGGGLWQTSLEINTGDESIKVSLRFMDFFSPRCQTIKCIFRNSICLDLWGVFCFKEINIYLPRLFPDLYCWDIVYITTTPLCPWEFTHSAAPNRKGCLVQRDVTHTGLISSYKCVVPVWAGTYSEFWVERILITPLIDGQCQRLRKGWQN